MSAKRSSSVVRRSRLQAPELAKAVDGKELLRTWMKWFARFKKAHARCSRSLSEKHVHELRTTARHCLPMLEVLRALEPKNGLWKLAHRGAHDLLGALGPLRDAQVRLLRLKLLPRADRSALMARTRTEEDEARTIAEDALQLFRQLPEKAVRDLARRVEKEKAKEWHEALVVTLEKDRVRLAQRWRSGRSNGPAGAHRARVALKRYRYLLLALDPCLSAVGRKRLSQLERLQTQFGEWHDDRVFADWLKDAGGPGRKAHRSFANDEVVRRRQVMKLLRGAAPC